MRAALKFFALFSLLIFCVQARASIPFLRSYCEGWLMRDPPAVKLFKEILKDQSPAIPRIAAQQALATPVVRNADPKAYAQILSYLWLEAMPLAPLSADRDTRINSNDTLLAEIGMELNWALENKNFSAEDLRLLRRSLRYFRYSRPGQGKFFHDTYLANEGKGMDTLASLVSIMVGMVGGCAGSTVLPWLMVPAFFPVFYSERVIRVLRVLPNPWTDTQKDFFRRNEARLFREESLKASGNGLLRGWRLDLKARVSAAGLVTREEELESSLVEFLRVLELTVSTQKGATLQAVILSLQMISPLHYLYTLKLLQYLRVFVLQESVAQISEQQRLFLDQEAKALFKLWTTPESQRAAEKFLEEGFSLAHVAPKIEQKD